VRHEAGIAGAAFLQLTEAGKISMFFARATHACPLSKQLYGAKRVEESPPMSRARPKFLNLFLIRQPVPAIVSVLHRISGALLFLFLWLFLVGLQRSLASPESYGELVAFLDHPVVKIVALGLLWAYLHHTFAGIRHLGLDLRLGIQLPGARMTAYAVLILGFGLTLLVGILLW
jgi:succinate dehydrogenase / fumarate reductase cytochrome b subunit